MLRKILPISAPLIPVTSPIVNAQMQATQVLRTPPCTNSVLDASLHHASGLTYLIDGDNYYLKQEWTTDGVPVRTDNKVVHIPSELKHKYVYATGIGPNMANVSGTFKFVGNIPGVNQFGGPTIIESYEVPDEATRTRLDTIQLTRDQATNDYNANYKHSQRVQAIDHQLKMLALHGNERAMSPIQDAGLRCYIELLDLYNQELTAGSSDTTLLQSNIKVVEDRIRARLIQWREFLQNGIAHRLDRCTNESQVINGTAEIVQAKKNLAGVIAQLAYVDAYKSDTDPPLHHQIAMKFTRVYFSAGEEPEATEIAPLAP